MAVYSYVQSFDFTSFLNSDVIRLFVGGFELIYKLSTQEIVYTTLGNTVLKKCEPLNPNNLELNYLLALACVDAYGSKPIADFSRLLESPKNLFYDFLDETMMTR